MNKKVHILSHRAASNSPVARVVHTTPPEQQLAPDDPRATAFSYALRPDRATQIALTRLRPG